jgi:phosphoglycolate phosphatase-like HAD superfamily hydrolase
MTMPLRAVLFDLDGTLALDLLSWLDASGRV